MEAFYAQWLMEKQQLLNELLSVSQYRLDLHIPLISRVLSHFREYVDRKSELAELDVFQVLSPNWMTAVERSFLCLGGLRSSVLFRLMPNSDLTIDQARQLEELKQVTIEEERALEGRKRRAEEAMTTVIALMAAHGDHTNGDFGGEAEGRVTELMHAVYIQADGLRWRILTTSIDILTTAQTVRFLAGIAHLQLRVRGSGLDGN